MTPDDVQRPNYADFDAWADENCPDAPPSDAFAQWLANRTGKTTIGRETNGDGLVIALPEDER